MKEGRSFTGSIVIEAVADSEVSGVPGVRSVAVNSKLSEPLALGSGV